MYGWGQMAVDCGCICEMAGQIVRGGADRISQLPVHHPFVEHKRRWQAKGKFLHSHGTWTLSYALQVMYALTKIKGVGRRYSNLVCKKADVDLTKRAGDLTSEELERIVTIIQNPLQCKGGASWTAGARY
jgi:hypothetical protein